MLRSASCHIEVTGVEGHLEVNCDCSAQTEEGDAPYEVSVSSEIDLDDLDLYISRCLLLFKGVIELAIQADDPEYEVTEAAMFVFSMVQAVITGTEFDMLS